MHIFINLTSNLYCLTPLFLIVCPLSISSSFVLFPIYSSKTGLCLLQYSQLRRGCDNVHSHFMPGMQRSFFTLSYVWLLLLLLLFFRTVKKSHACLKCERVAEMSERRRRQYKCVNTTSVTTYILVVLR